MKAWIFPWRGVRNPQSKDKFKITVARIEVAAPDETQVRVTFQIDREPTRFQVPVFLRIEDFDDTEMVKAARNVLHWTFIELAAQTQEWKLKAQELQQLSDMSLRPRA